MQAILPPTEECYLADALMPYHQHRLPYLALVLEGGYEECGNHGRIFAKPGTVLVHDALDSHLDRFNHCPSKVLNLRLREPLPGWWFATLDELDDIVRVAATDQAGAATLLLSKARAVPAARSDWIDQLAVDLIEQPNICLATWASEHGLRAEAVSRGFIQVFGISATRFRSESRTRLARRYILAGVDTLSGIAALAGFADQSHMTRSMLRFSGEQPGQLVKLAKKFKTA